MTKSAKERTRIYSEIAYQIERLGRSRQEVLREYGYGWALAKLGQGKLEKAAPGLWKAIAKERREVMAEAHAELHNIPIEHKRSWDESLLIEDARTEEGSTAKIALAKIWGMFGPENLVQVNIRDIPQDWREWFKVDSQSRINDTLLTSPVPLLTAENTRNSDMTNDAGATSPTEDGGAG